MNQETPFVVLGISPDAEPEVVAAAYRALARKYHPDLNPGVEPIELNARMARLNWAKEELDSRIDHWKAFAESSRHGSNGEQSTERPSSTAPPASTLCQIQATPQVVHLSGARGTNVTFESWADGITPDQIRARFQPGIIELKRLAPSGTHARFNLEIQDDFASSINDSLVVTIEFIAPQAIGAQTYVSIAPLNEQTLTQQYGERIAPARHASTDARIAFGRHRGRRFSDIAIDQPDYLEWMLREGAGSRIEQTCARMALDSISYGGRIWLTSGNESPGDAPRINNRQQQRPTRPRTNPQPKRPLPRTQRQPLALPDPERSSGLAQFFRGIFGKK